MLIQSLSSIIDVYMQSQFNLLNIYSFSSLEKYWGWNKNNGTLNLMNYDTILN